ncbi:MAG: cell division protein FtsL [Terracidiphilus sp.]
MAACASTTYFEPPRGWSPQIEAHNVELMSRQIMRRRGVPTPEIYFAKEFDNSRLEKMPDPERERQMRAFGWAVVALFLLIMVYGLQHFSAIEGGYRVESEKQTLEQLREQNRQLRLSEAELTQPARIDALARQYGLGEPQPGQVVEFTTNPNAGPTAMAQATPPPLGKAATSF